MSISDIQLVSVLVFVLAGLFLLQSLFVVFLFFVLRNRMDRIEAKSMDMTQRLGGQLRNIRALTHRIGETLQFLPDTESSIDKILEVVTDHLQSADRYAQSVLKRSTSEIDEIGRRIEVSLRQLERQTSQIDRWVRNPAINVSALLQGLIVGFREFFKTRPRTQPATHSADDDAFI
jgi:hypothetical protein